MFRFDAFKRPNSTPSTVETSASTTSGDITNNATPADIPTSFLRRIASSDTLRSSLIKKSTSKTTSNLSTSFSIPMPTSSWGMMTLSRLQDPEESELDDIVDLLTANKALLLLPVSSPSTSSALVDRDFVLDHVILHNNREEDNQVVSLSGIRGLFQKDQFIVLDVLSSQRQINALMFDRRSVFDTFSLDPASITADHPKYTILASHVQLPLRDDQLVSVMLIQRPLSKNEIVEWKESRFKDDLINTTILKDDPLLSVVNEFINNYKKDPPHSRDMASDQFMTFIYGIQVEIGHSEDSQERLERIESYICHQLYEYLFTHHEGDEAMQDEALESRIAALNLLDLDLKHLGVIIEDTEGEVNEVVKCAGNKLQQLNSIKGAKEKANTLVETHKIIVDTMEGFAKKHRDTTLDSDSEVVQEMNHVISHINEKKSSGLSSLNADILLPILIFTIVKSNPTNFLSNLKFIQRFCRPDELTGQTSYCLTNMMAAVSFLETTNLVGLGLSPDKVYSHVIDLNATPLEPTMANKSTSKSTTLNSSGMKIVSDVVDSSYRVFDGIGKLWQRSTQEMEAGNSVSDMVGQVKNRVRKMSDVAESMSREGLNELKEIATSTSAKSNQNDHIRKAIPSFMDMRNKGSKQKTHYYDGPIKKFLEVKTVEELTIGEVTELLADYKRLAATLYSE